MDKIEAHLRLLIWMTGANVLLLILILALLP